MIHDNLFHNNINLSMLQACKYDYILYISDDIFVLDLTIKTIDGAFIALYR